MTKLETLKKAFEEQGISEMLPKLAHNSWCVIELGKSYSPSIDTVDNLYTTFVSGVIANLGSEKTPVYLKREEIVLSLEKRFTSEGYMKLWNSLIELGYAAFPFEEWLKQNPESEKWVYLIEDAILRENTYKMNPEKWLIEFRESLIKRRM